MASIINRGPHQFQVIVRRKGHPTQTKTFESKKEAEAWIPSVFRLPKSGGHATSFSCCSLIQFSRN